MRRPSVPRDLAAIQRIWKEVGWVDDDDEAAHIEHFMADADVWVAETGGEVSCAVSGHALSMRYGDVEVPTWHISSVTTSFTGRKQGHAQALTAESLRVGAQQGHALAALGMFEQGFYNRLGFGCGSYELLARFDPGSLTIDAPYRPPVRFTTDDWAEVAEALRTRRRSHGGFAPVDDGWVRAEIAWHPSLLLGYRDGDGRLTHFIAGDTKGESGPYTIDFVCYQNVDQLMELMALIASLGDQVRGVFLIEPPEIQIQDLLRHPTRQKIVTQRTDFEVSIKASAWWQVRMLDVAACVAARTWAGEPLRFNLALTDPLSGMLTDGWCGVAGDYVVDVGPTSSASLGHDPSAPTLSASVNAFTRLWIGARPASSLALTDDLSGPPDLLDSLDRAFLLPTPRPALPL